MPPLHGLCCCITYPDGAGYNTMGGSLLDAAAKALEWIEVDCQAVGTARRFRDDQALAIGVGMAADRWYRVRVGRIRRWIGEAARTQL
jgi:hypothetical protein